MSLSAFDIDRPYNERRRAKLNLVPCADNCGALIKKHAARPRCIVCGYKRTEEARLIRDRNRKRQGARQQP